MCVCVYICLKEYMYLAQTNRKLPVTRNAPWKPSPLRGKC